MRSGKGCKRREIPLNPDARSALWLLGWDEHQDTDKPIMTGQRGKMTRRGLENLVEKYRFKLNHQELAASPKHITPRFGTAICV